MSVEYTEGRTKNRLSARRIDQAGEVEVTTITKRTYQDKESATRAIQSTNNYQKVGSYGVLGTSFLLWAGGIGGITTGIARRDAFEISLGIGCLFGGTLEIPLFFHARRQVTKTQRELTVTQHICDADL